MYDWQIESWYISTAVKQDEAAIEEKQALEKIAGILARLTSKKAAMVGWSLFVLSMLLNIEQSVQHLTTLKCYIRSQRHQGESRTQVYKRAQNWSKRCPRCSKFQLLLRRNWVSTWKSWKVISWKTHSQLPSLGLSWKIVSMSGKLLLLWLKFQK